MFMGARCHLRKGVANGATMKRVEAQWIIGREQKTVSPHADRCIVHEINLPRPR
jgi:hypothetical protein